MDLKKSIKPTFSLKMFILTLILPLHSLQSGINTNEIIIIFIKQMKTTL
jgi:hypothetical protein